jgi:hypothetical protein
MRSAFSLGWDAAKAHYRVPPKTRAVSTIVPPSGLSDRQAAWYTAGYMEWCSGYYQNRTKEHDEGKR